MLKNIFDYIGVLPFSPYANYENIKNDQSTLNEGEDFSAENLWRNFEISETGKRSIFTNMERLKITNVIIQQTINIPKLIGRKLI